MSKTIDLDKIKKEIKKFVKERDWEKFNSPKNLTMALAVEASELLEIFQWLNEKESLNIKNNPKKFQDVKDEIADIFVYIIRIADVLDIDIDKAFYEKMKKNKSKYPIISK
jgi:NTP pyrophosphatase (non-canonical NTP hydrolase)